MRIEADGYLPEERKGFTLDDREVNFDIKLKKAEDIKLTVKKPTAHPPLVRKVISSSPVQI